MKKPKNKATSCSKCGITGNRASFKDFEGADWCESCLHVHTSFCEECRERILRTKHCGAKNIFICEACYVEKYTPCESCYKVIHLDHVHMCEAEGGYYCDCCQKSRLTLGIIQTQDYQPEPIFYGKGLYLGVELGIDGGAIDDLHEEIHSGILDGIANRQAEHLYIRKNPSLRNGFELVSHPMSLEYHKQSMPWEQLLDKAAHLGYKPQYDDREELHVLVWKSGLGKSAKQQEEVIGSIINFFKRNWYKLMIVAIQIAPDHCYVAEDFGVAEDKPHETENQCELSKHQSCIMNNDPFVASIRFVFDYEQLHYPDFISNLELIETICQTAIKTGKVQIAGLD